MSSPDLVAQWQVPLSDGIHLIEFEHGTTTGKRIIRINGKVIVSELLLSGVFAKFRKSVILMDLRSLKLCMQDAFEKLRLSRQFYQSMM